MKMLLETIKMAGIHAEKIKYAMENLSSYFPLTVEMLEKLPEHKLLYFELLTSRFALLQEFIGSKIFPLLLAEAIEENVSKMSSIDKLNKLERLEIIDTTEEWKIMNKICNKIMKAYPEQSIIVAVKLYIDKMTFPELMKKLKAFSIIDDTAAWKELRNIRNRIIHQYPNKVEEMAELFNEVYNMAPKLLSCLDKINKIIVRL